MHCAVTDAPSPPFGPTRQPPPAALGLHGRDIGPVPRHVAGLSSWELAISVCTISAKPRGISLGTAAAAVDPEADALVPPKEGHLYCCFCLFVF